MVHHSRDRGGADGRTGHAPLHGGCDCWRCNSAERHPISAYSAGACRKGDGAAPTLQEFPGDSSDRDSA